MAIKIDEIICSKRKSISLTVTPEGHLVVKAPLNTPRHYLDDLIEQKRAWIEEKIQVVKERKARYQDKKYIRGEEFHFLGELYKLNFSKQETLVGIKGKEFLVPEKLKDQVEQYIKKWYRQAAKQILSERVEYYANLKGIPYQAVKITSASKRWESCSSKGNLNFTWKLMMAPLAVIDYVVVHELCHIEFPNHSKDFWSKVKFIVPDYKLKQEWLAENQRILEIM